LPGCNNVISVTVVQNVPLPANQSSIIITFNRTVAVGLEDGNVQLRGRNASMFFGNSSTLVGTGLWASASNSLRLNVASELPTCTNISFEFAVCNPGSVAQPVSDTLLQEAQPVMISAEGAGVGILPVGMDSSNVSVDYQPGHLYAPVFTTKNIGQSTPYPGVNNTITVTVATNFNMVQDTRVVIHGFEGAIISEGDVKLHGTNTSIFISLDGTEGHGTWVGCDKALVLVLNKALGCNTSSFVISFVVENELEAQDCVDVRINASVPSCLASGTYDVTQERISPDMSNAIGSRAVDSYSEAYLEHSENGFDMDHDLATKLSVFGAMMGDACPLLIWPSAFLVKDISQSSPYPCAISTISITLATNVGLLASGEEHASITISDMYMAEPDTESISVNSVSAAGQVSSESPLTNATWNVNDDSNMSSVTLYVKNGQECCAPDASGNGLTVISFNVTNAKTPQDASRYVSIAAAGAVVISASPMHNDYGDKWPFYVKNPEITMATIAQSSSAPCSVNTISLQFKFNSKLVCASTLTIAGLSSIITCDRAKGISGTGFSLGSVNCSASADAAQAAVTAVMPSVALYSDEQQEHVLLLPIQENLAKGATVDLEFSFVNPGKPVLDQALEPAVELSMSGLVASRSPIQVPQDVLSQPLTVTAAAFEKAIIVQSTPFPGEVNTITVTFRTTAEIVTSTDCESAITISGLRGACVSGQTLQLSGDSDAMSHNLTLTSGGTALWNASESSITMFITNNSQIIAQQDYVISFDVTNPTHPQESNPVTISASGVAHPALEMSIGAGPTPGVDACHNPACVFPFMYRGVAYTSCTNVDYGDKYWCATETQNTTRSAFEAVEWEQCACNVTYSLYPQDAAPLYVRGDIEDFGLFKIGQNSSQPGAANLICVTFATNLPLVSSLPVFVTVSGLSGARAPSGALPSTQMPSGHFASTWDDSEKKLVLEVLQDTVPEAEYSVCSVLKNPTCAQASPEVHIEASGIAIQPTSPSDAHAATEKAVLRVDGPEILDADIQQTNSMAGGANELTITFASTVDLTYDADKPTHLIVRGLEGVSLAAGRVPITGATGSSFNATWGDGPDTLTLTLVSSILARENVEVKLPFTNALVSQGAVCTATLELHSKQLGCPMGPVALVSSAALRGTAQEALRIQQAESSAECFTVKAASQSSSAPGATNTITLSLRPPVSLSSDYAVVVSGLVGATTQDSMLRLLNSPSGFRPFARWTSSSGTLSLVMASGQTMSSNQTSIVKFDLTNPNYPQDSPSSITVSVPGNVNISQCAMDLAQNSDAHPLKVDAPRFKVGSAKQSCSMPGCQNTIRVSLQPNVVLSKSRQSVIVIDGLRGSKTLDTSSLHLNLEQGTGLASQASWRQSTGTLTVVIEGEMGTSSDTVFSFVLENSEISERGSDTTSVMVLGDMPIGASSLPGDAMQLTDLNDAQEIFAVCTAQKGSHNCSTSLEGIAMNRSLYVLKVELQCNSGAANITVNTIKQSQNATQKTQLSGVQQLPASCQDQCHKYHTVLDWTPLDSVALEASTTGSGDGSLEVAVAADGLQIDYCGAGDILKAIVTLRMSAS